MKTWRLVSGIISMVLSLVIILQSCAVGVLEAMGAEGNDSASGIIVAILLIAGGIVSVVTSKGGNGGSIAIICIYGIAAVIGFTAKVYGDLIIWAVWCCVCALMAVLALIKGKKRAPSDGASEK